MYLYVRWFDWHEVINGNLSYRTNFSPKDGQKRYFWRTFMRFKKNDMIVNIRNMILTNCPGRQTSAFV